LKKKLLIHSIVFSPDGVSTAYLYNDIAIGFKEAGFDVVVLTTTPHYNLIESELKKQQLQKKLFGLFYTSQFHGIEVFHVPQKKFKSFGMRAIGFVYWHFLSFFIGIFLKNISIIISPSPPLTIGFLSWLIAKIKKAKVIYNVQEIYPDLLINQGSVKSKFLLSILKKLELFVYNHSDAVVTIDDVFYKTIVGRFINKSKLYVIPNFVDTELYTSQVSETIKLDQSIFYDTGELKLMYAGNIGHAQDWKPLVAIAKQMLGKPISFWVIGEGVVKTNLEIEIIDNDLNNIHLLPYQHRETMSTVNAFADLHFIFMNPELEGQGFPSKVYTIMACKKPILVLSSEGTPIVNFLKDKDCSYLVTSASFNEKIANVILILEKLLTDKIECHNKGEKGRLIIELNYSKEVVVRKYISLVNQLLSE
jgi:glycosyltransferase involved in cell wall biosynthesis